MGPTRGATMKTLYIVCEWLYGTPWNEAVYKVTRDMEEGHEPI